MESDNEPFERPTPVSRPVVTGLLTKVFGQSLPTDLMGPLLDYFVTKGVVEHRGGSFDLASKPGLLGSFPNDAERALHQAIIAHAGTPACPTVLRLIIPALRAGGSGSVSQGAGSRQLPSKSNVSNDTIDERIARLQWERQEHIASLSAFGSCAARVFDAILESLKPKRKVATPKSGTDLAINNFRLAHREWESAIPHTGVRLVFMNAEGRAASIDYSLPSGDPLELNTPEEQARFGFATPEWSSMPQPILVPPDETWRAAHDACAAARITLADAADALAATIDGLDDSSKHLRLGAQRLARTLRQVPPVWPTKVEVDLAFEINNGRIVEYRQSVNEARRRREAAEAAATEERRKQKAEQAADELIEWKAKQGKHKERQRAKVSGREPTAMQIARRRDVLLALPASDRIAIEGSGVLLAKLRERAAEARKRERVPVRHDKDSLRRDLGVLRDQKLVHRSLLLRTPKGDRAAEPPE